MDPRPVTHLIAAAKLYPNAWKLFELVRQNKKTLGDWPEWCYCPLAGAYAIVSGGGDNRLNMQSIGNVARLGGLAAWRPTQGIYRFDPDIYQDLIDTPLTGDLPSEILKHLPEWCVYIETPNMDHFDPKGSGPFIGKLHGFFAYLEYDVNNGREELRFLLDGENLLFPFVLHLGHWSVTESIMNAGKVAVFEAREKGLKIPIPTTEELQPTVNSFSSLISLLLYLCQPEPDYDTTETPKHPEPKKTKKGLRLFPPDKPRTWNVGVRMGTALRHAKAAQQETTPGNGTHNTPRPHMRRAHWHTYRIGPQRAETTLKWLPPIPVNLDINQTLPAVIHPAKK